MTVRAVKQSRPVDLTTREGRLHAWARVIARYPKRPKGGMPRIDVIRRTRVLVEGSGEWLGRYAPDAHIVHIMDGSSEEEAIHTLIHELAHAFAPSERLHHGPSWQTTYVELTSWLFGVTLTVDYVRGIALEDPTMITKYGRGHRLTEAALDIASYTAILQTSPSLCIRDGELVAIFHRPDRTESVHSVTLEA